MGKKRKIWVDRNGYLDSRSTKEDKVRSCQADDNKDCPEPFVFRTSNGNTEWKYVLQHSPKSAHPHHAT